MALNDSLLERRRRRTGWITHEACGRHEMGEWHPERPARLHAIAEEFVNSGLAGKLHRMPAPLATEAELERVHPHDYVTAIIDASPDEGYVQIDPDTALNPHSVEAALRAAGAVIAATDAVLARTVDNAFCMVRPPGHHAEATRAMGFCIFNSIGVGIAHALEAHGLNRVAVVDFDVHHGNGTEQMFAGDQRVLMVSTFQHPFYPYSGTDQPAANMINVPLRAGANGLAFREEVLHQWLPALTRFRPEMIFISAGFDAHRDDDMAGLNFSEDDYAWVTRELMRVADKHAKGRVVSTLEGGYNLRALALSAAAHVRELLRA
ncbi:MAG: histone deacetylase family protein [Betaproteobacteria bacterium]|nr:histone deacetylase family protein [Betaproteobacteria bacterium]